MVEPLDSSFQERELRIVPETTIERVSRRVVIVIHGASSLGEWCRELRSLIDENGESFDVYCTSHSDVSVAGAVVWSKRRHVYKSVRKQIVRAMEHSKASDEVSIIAHSYGTFVAAWVLNDLDGIRLKNLILLAGIANGTAVRKIVRKKADQVINDVGVHDFLPSIAGALRPWTYEAIGTFGVRQDKIANRFFPTGHSGVVDVRHLKSHIVPVLLDKVDPATSPLPGPRFKPSLVDMVRAAAVILAAAATLILYLLR